MSDADSTIITTIVLDTQQALASDKEFRTQINLLKNDLQALTNASKASGEVFGSTGERIKVSFAAMDEQIRATIKLMRELENAQQRIVTTPEGGQKIEYYFPENKILGTPEKVISDEQVQQVERFKRAITDAGLSVDDFVKRYTFTAGKAVDETLKMYDAQGKFNTSIETAVVDISKAEIIYAQLSAAEAKAYSDLKTLIDAQKISVGNTIALSEAQKALIETYKQQQLTPFMEGGKIKAGAYETKEFAQANQNIADYESNVRTAASAIKKEWQDVATAERLADQETKRQKKVELQSLESIQTAWSNRWQNKFRSAMGMTVPQPPKGWGKDLLDEEGKLITKTNSLGSSFNSLGGIAKFVFGSILGITAVTALRNIISWMMQGVSQAIEYQRSLTLIQIGIRALEREGFDTTIASWTEKLAEFKKMFPVFTQQEIVGAFSVAILKLREYGATQEQINRILGISATLSIAYGRDFQEMTNAVTGAITRGYYEALQSMGIAIGRINVMQRALREGMAGSFTQLSEQERFQLAFNILDDNVKEIEEDAKNLGTEGEAAFIRLRKATADATDAQRKLGESFVETRIRFEEFKASFLKLISAFPVTFSSWSAGIDNFSAHVSAAIAKLSAYVEFVPSILSLQGFSVGVEKLNTELSKIDKKLGDERKKIAMDFLKSAVDVGADLKTDVFQPYLEYLRDTDAQALQEIHDYAAGVTSGLEDVPPIDPIVKYKEFITQMLNEMKVKWEEYTSAVRDLDTQAALDRGKAWDEFYQKLIELQTANNERVREINKDADDSRIDAEKDYLKKLADLDAQYVKDKKKALDDLNKDLANLKKDYDKQTAEDAKNYAKDQKKLLDDLNKDLAKNQQTYNDNELQAEADFQNDMAKLRRDYLYDLEDALRERDAVQIMRLTRQYHKNQQEAATQAALDKAQRAKEFAQQQEDRRKQYEEDKAQRAADYAEQRAERAAEYAERVAERKQEYEEQLLLLKQMLEEQRAQAQEDYKQQLQDIEDRRQQQLNENSITYAKERGQAEAEREQRNKEIDDQYKIEKDKLDAHLAEEFNAIADNLTKSYNFSKEKMGDIDKLITDEYGPNSAMAKFWDAFSQYAMERALAADAWMRWLYSDVTNLLNGLIPNTGSGENVTPPGQNPGIPGGAKGGKVEKGKLRLIGEEGPELFVPEVPGEIIPANMTQRIMRQLSTSGNTNFSNNLGNLSGVVTQSGVMNYNVSGNLSRKDQVGIEIILSPDLEGRIIDTTLREAAGVIVDVVNRRR